MILQSVDYYCLCHFLNKIFVLLLFHLKLEMFVLQHYCFGAVIYLDILFNKVLIGKKIQKHVKGRGTPK